MEPTTEINQPSLTIPVGTPCAEWEGMTYVAISGDDESLKQMGIGKVENNFRDAYVSLHNSQSGKYCGAIVKQPKYDTNSSLSVDPCLLSDLSAEVGSTLEVRALKPVPACQVHLAVSSTDLAPHELQNLCKTYLARHPLCPGQRKPIYLLTGEKITVEIIDVKPHPLCIYTNTTELVVDSSKHTVSTGGLDEIGGLEHEKQILRERILLPLTQPDFFTTHGIRPPRGILLCGPPGCGKTMITRALAGEIDAQFLEINGSEIFSATYGESEKVINDVFDKARKKTPAIILIDEIDTLGFAREATKGNLERRLVTALLTAMDGLRCLGNVIVVGTTNTPNSLDPALRRPGRFDYEIHIGVPDKCGRLDILNKKTAHMAIAADVDLEDIARRTHGFVGADIMSLCREAAFAALTVQHPLNELVTGKVKPLLDVQIKANDFEHALKRVKPSALREFAVEVPSHLGWNDVGGLDNLKDTLVQEVIQGLNDPAIFEQVGIKPTRGLLLYGPPGTGKTLIARVIANEAEANFISIKGPEVLSKWVGESEQRIRHLFAKARESSPCIIFFDEIDAITATRGYSVNDAADRVVNQLLTEMDGFDTSKHVCVIGATNRIDTLDPALLRPGRFDHQIEVPLPDTAGLKSIYRIHCQGKPINEDCDYDLLASKSRAFSGAHVAEVCRRAALCALRENGFCADKTRITQQHLLDAIGKVRKTIIDVGEPKIGFTAVI